MYHPISTKMHAFLDYLTVGAFLTIPRLLPCKESTKNMITAMALARLGYTLLTRHEGGLYKILPMKAHLVMDVLGGSSIAAIPFVTDEEDFTTTALCLGMGFFDVAAAPMTQTQMPGDEGRYADYEQDVSQYRVEHDRSALMSNNVPDFVTSYEFPASSIRDTGAHVTSGGE